MFQEDSLHAVLRNQTETDQLVVLYIILLDIFEDESNICLCHGIHWFIKDSVFATSAGFISGLDVA